MYNIYGKINAYKCAQKGLPENVLIHLYVTEELISIPTYVQNILLMVNKRNREFYQTPTYDFVYTRCIVRSALRSQELK